jgi:S1-C subfamily serine protease
MGMVSRKHIRTLVFALAGVLITSFPLIAQQSDIGSLIAAAKAGEGNAQDMLGYRYLYGDGVQKNLHQAFQLFLMAARQNVASAQANLGYCYMNGFGVEKDSVQAYAWNVLAADQGIEAARKNIGLLNTEMSRRDIARARAMARQFNPTRPPAQSGSSPPAAQSNTLNTGTAFFVTDDGFAVSALHVVEKGGGRNISLVMGGQKLPAKEIRTDVSNDLVLLKVEGEFVALPVASSAGVKLGDPVTTIGFPLPELEGTAPKFSRGEIDALSGLQNDDERYFQMSAPVGPGNSGGALMDQRGNVIGVVTGTLTATLVLQQHGVAPENVNYATKGSVLRKFLESDAEVSSKLKEPYTDETKPADLIDQLQKATAQVVVTYR